MLGRWQGRKVWFLSLGLFAFALILRIWFAGGSPDRELYYSVLHFDAVTYYNSYAEHLADKSLFNEGLSYYPPLPAYLLAIVYKTGASSPVLAKWIYILMGALVPVFVYHLGRSVFSERTGLWGGVLSAIAFGGLVLSSGINAEIPFQLSLLAALIVGARIDTSPKPLVNCLCVGILCGFMALTTLSGLWIILPFILHMLVGTKVAWRKRVLNALVLLIATIVIILPWSIRCYKLLEIYSEYGRARKVGWTPGMGLVTVTVPLHFAMGNNVLADGGYNYDLVGGKIAGGKAFLSDYNVRTLMTHGFREGVHFMSTHPGMFVKRLLWQKFARLGCGLTTGFLAPNLPCGIAGIRPANDFFVPDCRWPALPVLAFFVLGLVWSCFRSSRPALLYWIIVFFAAWTALFAGSVSTGVLLLPLVHLFCLWGAGRLILMLRHRGLLRRMTDILMLCLVVLSLVIGIVDYSREKILRLEGERDLNTGKILQHKPVKIEIESAPVEE
ncbi:ArnT family glycosyltransferase [Acidobacteriota bacterium]